LGLRRSVVRSAALAAGFEPWDDPTNDDPAFTRSRVRHDLLPVLESALGPRVVEALGRTAEMLTADADALDRWAADCDPGDVEVDVVRLAALPVAVRRRVLRLMALRAGAPAGALSFAHLTSLDALVTNWHGQGPVPLPGALSGVRTCGRLAVRPASAPSAGREQ
jgi:tRNA(Ile)-lysidine synthase